MLIIATLWLCVPLMLAFRKRKRTCNLRTFSELWLSRICSYLYVFEATLKLEKHIGRGNSFSFFPSKIQIFDIRQVQIILRSSILPHAISYFHVTGCSQTQSGMDGTIHLSKCCPTESWTVGIHVNLP